MAKEQTKRLYVAPMYTRWDEMKVALPGRDQKLSAPKGSPGCMIVFNSIDDMKEMFPGVDEDKVLTFMVSA